MKGYKKVLNELPVSKECHLLSDDELHRLQLTMLNAYKEIEAVCLKHNLAIAMAGGNAIGAIRHKGFIPWDDDVDLLMSRKDFEAFKKIFPKELGDKYVLNAPNYSAKPTNRFPKILIKGTKFVEMAMEDDDRACIKMDLFILENMPENKIVYKVKGLFCNALMYIASVVDTYEHRAVIKDYMSATEEGRKMYKRRALIGRIFSFRSSYSWFNTVDKCCQYHKKSSLVADPCGTYHYFGTTMKRKLMYPFRKVPFENTTVFIPNDYDAYLTKLYGNYMEIPPVEKQEHHYVRKISFGKEENN